MLRFEAWERLEPSWPEHDADRGIAAELADPAWLLGRQWQFGEHQGEDLASAVEVDYALETVPLSAPRGQQDQPTTAPLAAVLQGEPHEWWTLGRRIRVGASTADHLPPPIRHDPRLLFTDLPPPYEGCNGGIDGWRAWQHRDETWLRGYLPGEPFAEVPQPTGSSWDRERLEYRTELSAGDATLQVRQPRAVAGADWFSLDATSTPSAAVARRSEVRHAIVARVRHSGSPVSRFWQIEDPQTDPGGTPPSPSRFAQALVTTLLTTRSDDWYSFPVDLPVGQLSALRGVVVRDCFGDEWPVSPPADWSLHRVRGLPADTVLVLPACPSPVVGPEYERVDLAVDEDANVLWAVERRLFGREVVTLRVPEPIPERSTYRPVTGAYERWYPYLRDGIGYLQGRLLDPDTVTGSSLPQPEAVALQPTGEGPHRLAGTAVPATGMCLTQRYVLARATDGAPLLWLRNEVSPLSAPVAPGLRFDAIVPGKELYDPVATSGTTP